MKIILNRLYYFVFLLQVFLVLGAPNPPSPRHKLPPPPPSSIDQNVLFVAILGLLFGIYITSKINLKDKTSN